MSKFFSTFIVVMILLVVSWWRMVRMRVSSSWRLVMVSGSLCTVVIRWVG